MSIELYPSVAKVKRNGVYQNLPGFVQQSSDADIEAMIAISESSTTAQFPHKAGSYFILNDVLYQADDDIAVNDIIAVGTNCHIAILSNDVANQYEMIDDLKSDIELNTGNQLLTNWTNNTYYKLTSAITSININSPISSSGWQSMCIPCNAGDVFYLTCTANNVARPWAFLSSASGENNIISKAGATETTPVNLKLIAPAGAVYAIFNSNPTETAYVIKGELVKNIGWTFTNVNIPWEIGNIAMTNSGATYSYDRYTRARTPQGYSLYLHKDDVVCLTNYTDACFYLGWTDDSGTWHQGGSWKTADYKVTQNGKYIFVLRNNTEVSLLGNMTSLTNLFFVKIKTEPNQIYSESNKYTERYVWEHDSGLFNHLFNKASPKFAMHRGANTLAPENTVPAFELAGDSGAWGIETDVYETTDGYFILSHDNDVSRMTDGTGNITEMTYAETQECTIDAGSNIEEYPNLKMPQLSDFLAICRRYGCVGIIEIKTITNYDNMINVIKSSGMENNVVLLLSIEQKVPVVRYYTKVPICIIGYDDTNNSEMIDKVSTIYNTGVNFAAGTVSNSTDIIKAHENNMPVIIWTVDSESDADDMFRLGVDVIISNSIAQFS